MKIVRFTAAAAAENEPCKVCPLSSYRSPRFTDDSAQDKAVKSMDLENKGKDKTTAESDLVTTKSDLDATQKELDAALAYYAKLKDTIPYFTPIFSTK